MKLIKHYLSIIYLIMEVICSVVVNSPEMEKIPSLVGRKHKFLGVLSSTVRICQIKHVHSSTVPPPCEKYWPPKRSFSFSSFNSEVIHQGLKYIFHGSDWSECNFCISVLKSRFLSLARYWRGTKSNSSVKVWTVFHYFLGCCVI